ncbi:MAG TPA: LPS export ABC transporter periplasmic protein LptC, partial [Aquabacterium sp.]|nr:LPS export ABC transporter periplasmic protein LptC [Aquabacterium sp.]
MNARGWLWLERAQAALPLLGAAALAGVTWWLVQSASEDTGPASAAKVSSAPDYELQQARIVRVDAQGRLEAVLDGQRIRHYPATDQLHVDTLALSARDAQGQGLQATAHEGVADQRAEVVTLQGDVRA